MRYGIGDVHGCFDEFKYLLEKEIRLTKSHQAFLESSDFEDAIRTAISIGGDSDTIACMAGSIAEAYYREIPQTLFNETFDRLPPPFITVIEAFQAKYNV